MFLSLFLIIHLPLLQESQNTTLALSLAVRLPLTEAPTPPSLRRGILCRIKDDKRRRANRSDRTTRTCYNFCRAIVSNNHLGMLRTSWVSVREVYKTYVSIYFHLSGQIRFISPQLIPTVSFPSMTSSSYRSVLLLTDERRPSRHLSCSSIRLTSEGGRGRAKEQRRSRNNNWSITDVICDCVKATKGNCTDYLINTC